MLRAPWGPAATVGIVGLVVTAVVTLSPAVRLAYYAPALHVAIETVAALAALVAAYLMIGRFRRRERLDDLILAHALGMFGLTNLVFGAVPTVVGDGAATRYSTWAVVVGRILATAALTTAALVPAIRVTRPWLRRGAPFAPAAVLVAVAVVMAILAPRLPAGVETVIPPERSARPRLVGHPLLLGAQVLMLVLFVIAAAGFAHRRARERDELFTWLSVASVLGALARVNYALFPSVYTRYVYSGDAFHMLFYVAILVAAAREIRSYWRAVADAAVLEERRRLARDLHDGIAQEIAFIARGLRRLDPEASDPAVRRLRAGAERAMAESRRAIAALTEPLDRPLGDVLAQAAREVAEREGASVALQLAPGARAAPGVRDALVRIASEAITNAARHGRADLIRVTLEDDGALRLRIADAGRGFDPAAVARGGFGLTSMRERAQALGGRFDVTSAPGRGTEVEVVL